jgi:hypothetical protein
VRWGFIPFRRRVQSFTQLHDPRLKKVAFKSTKQDSHFVAFRIPYTSYVGTKHESIDFIEENLVFESLGEDLGSSNRVEGACHLFG